LQHSDKLKYLTDISLSRSQGTVEVSMLILVTSLQRKKKKGSEDGDVTYGAARSRLLPVSEAQRVRILLEG